LYRLTTNEKEPATIISAHAAVDYAVSVLRYYRVSRYRVYESFSGTALHNTTLYYFSILLPLSITWLRRSNGQSPVKSTVYSSIN